MIHYGPDLLGRALLQTRSPDLSWDVVENEVRLWTAGVIETPSGIVEFLCQPANTR